MELESLIAITESGGTQKTMFQGGHLVWRALQILFTFQIPADKQVAGVYLHVLSFVDPPSGAEQQYSLTSWPFHHNSTEGGPSVAIGDAVHCAGVAATKSDVEKLMAQNVQLMQAMTTQQHQLAQQQASITSLLQEKSHARKMSSHLDLQQEK